VTDAAISSFPRRHAATRRFTLGAPRSFTVAADGESVLFLQSSGGTDPVNSLWRLERGGGEPQLLFDAAPAETGELTAAERARRERAREQASGVVAYVVDDAGQRAVFVLGGALHRVEVATGGVEVLETAEVVFDPRPEPGANRVAYVSGSSLRLTDGTADRELAADVSDSSTDPISGGRHRQCVHRALGG